MNLAKWFSDAAREAILQILAGFNEHQSLKPQQTSARMDGLLSCEGEPSLTQEENGTNDLQSLYDRRIGHAT